MAKSPKPNPKTRKPEDETREEINRQHKLLALDFDKKALKGSVKQEEFRHHKEYKGLAHSERREYFQIQLQRDEALKELKKVRHGYTGHYDDSISPIENIQSALRQQNKSPLKSARLSVPNVYPLRKVRSQEAMPTVRPKSATGQECHSSAKPSVRAQSPVQCARSKDGRRAKSPRPPDASSDEKTRRQKTEI